VPGSDLLLPDSRQLAAILDLLVRHGERSELTFLVAGYVPEACQGRADCQETRLLKQRAASLIDSLRALWPSSHANALERVYWKAVPSDSRSAERDRVQILLRENEPAQRLECPGQIELRDAYLPGTVENPDKEQWIAISGKRPTYFSSSALLRVRPVSHEPQDVHVLIFADGKERQIQPQHDVGPDEAIYQFDTPASSFWISLISGTDEQHEPAQALARSEGLGTRMADNVLPYSAAAQDDEGRAPRPCSFAFKRWNP
jgi:hypothetical protein